MMMENTASKLSETMNPEKLKEKVDRVKTRVVEKTQGQLHATSKTVDDLMVYLKEHDTQAMVDDLNVVVRKHPGKSLLAGLVFGVLVGRLFSRF